VAKVNARRPHQRRAHSPLPCGQSGRSKRIPHSANRHGFKDRKRRILGHGALRSIRRGAVHA
jgi:hypothetical protein